MKKIILATTLIFGMGILSSQVKINNMKTTSVTVQNFNISSCLKNLASAD